MSSTNPKKHGKRPEPELQFFQSPEIDRMAQMLLVMAAEVHVLRDRLHCLEFILTERGDLAPGQVDRFIPNTEQARRLQQEREAFVAHLFEVLDGRAKSTSGRGNPLVPATPGHTAHEPL